MKKILILIFCMISMSLSAQDFITVKNGHFLRDGKPYYYVGTNLWYGSHPG